jgi:TubC N-terminal docking domain
MTAVALDLLQAVSAAGGLIWLESDTLRLAAPQPLTDELRARLRQHKAEIVALLSAPEPANDQVLERQPPQDLAGLPQEIADGVRAILSADGARGIPPQRWSRVQRDAARLVDGGWLEPALALDWSAADLFGCDRRAPWHRLDRAGLVLLISRHEIVEVTAHDAALRTTTGSVLRYRRRQPAIPPLALLWELLISAPATGPPIRGPTAHPDKERMAATYLAGPRRHPDHDHSEGTIMAGSTLRVQRSEATAISGIGRLRRSGARQ